MSEFNLEILSPEGVAFKGDIVSVSFPTTSGDIVVLPGHANLVSILKQGDILVTPKSGEVQKITVTGGFIEVSDHKVNVAAQFAVPSDDSNRQKIEEALKFAKALQEKKKDEVDISIIETQLRRTISSLKSGVTLKRKF
ncbi:MAG: ATP synthase F1 subunit epsilon [Endomicrobium sp.]|jgi:F-type H+-transporting ATPase subunit epsilon|nr:ATP synthase F1 subunit epsilon [Endomicrobium sp.]